MKTLIYLKMVACALMGFACARVACAAESTPQSWYVANDGVDEEGRGTEKEPFHSLQYAHDKAAAGDTIYVKPGIYDYGEVPYQWRGSGIVHTNRLVVSKKLYFWATGTKEETHIVGKWDTSSSRDSYGRGPAGIRCILVTKDGADSEFHKFTLRDGATDYNGGHLPTAGSEDYAGGFAVLGDVKTSMAKDSAGYKAFLVDSVISNCVAKFGGAIRGGTSIRCLFKDNGGTSWGQTAIEATLWNCVVAENHSFQSDRPVLGNYVKAINTTIAGTAGCGFMQGGIAYNCVFTAIGGEETNKSYSVKFCPNTYWQADDKYPLVAPPLGDYRLVKGTPANGGGLTKYFTENVILPADIEMKDYLGRDLDLTQETCDAGAIQGAVESATGVLTIPAKTLVDGAYRSIVNSYVHGASFPTTFSLKPVNANFARYYCEGNLGEMPAYKYTRYEGDALFMPPLSRGEVIRISENLHKHIIWCDPHATASEATGSEEKPFRTLQAAVDYAKTTWGEEFVTIFAMPGDYREGSAFALGHSNRVVIASSQPMLIKSIEGAASTTIWGESDPTGPEPINYPGCGPRAMRCLYVGGSSECNAAIQGFTFANGHSGCSQNYTTDIAGDRVGGIHAKTIRKNFQILDSVITNCVAVRGGAAYYGTFTRCKIYDSVSYGGVMRYSWLCESYVDGSNRVGTGGNGATLNAVLGTDVISVLCTIMTKSTSGSVTYSSSVFSNLSVQGTSTYPGSICRVALNGEGNPFDTLSTKYHLAQYGDLCFVDEAAGDFRLITANAADVKSGEVLPAYGTAEWGAWCTNLMAAADFGLDNEKPLIRNGNVLPGCYQKTADGIHVVAQNGGLSVTGGDLGFTPVADDLALTVTKASATRPIIGFLVNDETNLFTKSTSITFTKADVAAAGGGIKVSPIYTCDWYVNADAAYSDANDGFTPETAKKTLKGAMAANLLSGDTIHAAAGVYDQEKMLFGATDDSGKGTYYARVVIPEGVTLQGAGAGETFIVGEKDSSTEYGIGANAVKCVYLRNNSTLRDVTLTGGYAGMYSKTEYATDWAPDFSGAGVCGTVGRGRDTAFVYDSVISNCWAYTAGGARWCSLVRCKLFENHSINQGGAAREINMYGCVVNRSYSGSTVNEGGVYSFTKIYNCTFGADNWTFNGTLRNVALNSVSSKIALLQGCLVLGGVKAINNSTFVNLITNCVFRGDCSEFSSKMASSSRSATEAETQVDGELRPIVGANVAVDAADESIVPAILLKSEKDAAGGQRVYNGRWDVGALEGDYRDTYAALLGERLSVVAADPHVYAGAGKVIITNGSLIVSWKDARAPRTKSLQGTVAVTGNGTLTVGATEYNSADGAVTKKWPSTALSNTLQFTYQPGADEGAAELYDFEKLNGLVLTIR